MRGIAIEIDNSSDYKSMQAPLALQQLLNFLFVFFFWYTTI